MEREGVAKQDSHRPSGTADGSCLLMTGAMDVLGCEEACLSPRELMMRTKKTGWKGMRAFILPIDGEHLGQCPEQLPR
eukprot:355893-Chlamydomonas_euryale.AAC.3